MPPTPADGSALIRNLGPASYSVSAVAPGYSGASQQVVLTNGRITTVEIRLESTAGILVGQVIDASSGAVLAGARVSLAGWTAVTDDTGHYRLEGVHPGEYMVQVDLEGYGPHQAHATIESLGSHTLDVGLFPVPGLLKVLVVDAATGLPIEGATVSYGTVVDAPAQAEQPCADYGLLVPLKRSSQYRAVRLRVSDPSPSDNWQQDGLHFFVFALKPDDLDRDARDATSAVEPPVAVFVMRPDVQEPVSAVVVRPRPDGQEAEVTSLGEGEALSVPMPF